MSEGKNLKLLITLFLTVKGAETEAMQQGRRGYEGGIGVPLHP